MSYMEYSKRKQDAYKKTLPRVSDMPTMPLNMVDNILLHMKVLLRHCNKCCHMKDCNICNYKKWAIRHIGSAK